MEKQIFFEFGKNWQSFSRIVDEERLNRAQASLVDLLGHDGLVGKSFLDVGCGSGLFSIAAARLGAARVIGIDIDPVSVATSQENARKWASGSTISFQVRSVLDQGQMLSLGRFDVVYSWGVLHHTGNMHRAFEISSQCVSPGGKFVVAIYNRHVTSPIWWLVKWFYNFLPAFGRRILVWVFTPIIFVAKFITTRKNPMKMKRGMDFIHNIVDWLGGYPYEYASVSEMTTLLQARGLKVTRVIPAIVPTGCNEFVCIADI